ncbi:MAG: FliG C-terminal domain-containing protein [Pirellulaceae bacterium]|nr:FliG C-terminal domain-containing protein [Pirellulaceae bacterium]
MNKSESNDRIRQVAIVLSSVDAATARSLLGTLPATQARLVRQQLATLTNITPSERASASKMIAQLKSQAGASSKQTSQATRSPPPSHSSSPAEALLSAVPVGIDSIELTDEYSPSSDPMPSGNAHIDWHASAPCSIGESGFAPLQRYSEQPFDSPSSIPSWQHWNGAELTKLLMNERPSLIAAVLLHAPEKLGSEILQTLAPEIATSVLAALPQLHTTDPTVLQEIYSELHQRLVDFKRQSSPENVGMTKLQALLSMVSSETRHRLEQRLAAQQPLLAHALGVSTTPNPIVTMPSTPSPQRVAAVAISQQTEHRHDDTPVTVKFPKKSVDPSFNATPGISIDSFESLVSLSLEDFALVLRSVDPQTILLATSGGSQKIQERVEQLLDPKDIKRLRDRIESLRSTRTKDKQLAQTKVLQAAQSLFQQGRIASLANMTILAAA